MELKTPLSNFLRLTERQKKALKRLGLTTAKDLLWHFPFRYEKPAEAKIIAELCPDETVALAGKILEIKMEKTWRKKMPIAKALISDGSGALRLVWFHQPYIAKMLKQGDFIKLSGKVQKDKNGLYIANPNYGGATSVGYSAIYPETRGISSRWFQNAVKKILKQIDFKKLEDPIPASILKKYRLPSLKFSLVSIHFPKKTKDAEAARKRFAFEEIFFIQLGRLKARTEYNQQPSFPVKIPEKELKDFTDSFPFELTSAQEKAIKAIINDFQKSSPMARLLEGDVGSGKTVVAAAAAFAAVKNGFQAAYMAPTEVLARQHFETFTKLFAPLRIKIGLITSSECLKFPSKVRGPKGEEQPTHISRSQLLKWIFQGETPILIGTHALIQGRVRFKNLALAVVDEQHRFGVRQRARLVQNVKNVLAVENEQLQQAERYNKRSDPTSKAIPHLLSMTATPIPRTLALTMYGDLDLTLLDQMPPGRKEIKTIIVPPEQRERAYEQMREEIKKGRQAYVVCPRIEAGSEKLEIGRNPISRFPSLTSNFQFPTSEIKAVKEEYEKLKKDIFPEFEVAMLHGQMTTKEKEKTMQEFRQGKINLLVATSVIEVGVDVANATIIMIEGAERFGLAQLHQLRGRVLRSTHQPYCFIFTDSPSKKTLERLQALTQAKNGFELAEYDLKFRGPGELAGKKQWGISDVGMEALKNLKMVEAARTEAQEILQKDPELKTYSLISTKINQSQTQPVHFE